MNKQHRRLLSLLKRKLQSHQKVDAWRLRIKNAPDALAGLYLVTLLKYLKRDQRLQSEINEWVYCNIKRVLDHEYAVEIAYNMLGTKTGCQTDEFNLFSSFNRQCGMMLKLL